MKVAVGADHNGVEAKAALVRRLRERGDEVLDFGSDSKSPYDYPLVAEKVALAVSRGEVHAGVLLCGSGIGMAIAANKVPGVRAAVVLDLERARLAREHNDANVLSLDSWGVPVEENVRIAETFLDTPFSGVERHARRVAQIREIERRYGLSSAEAGR